jgi:hypothetical protein
MMTLGEFISKKVREVKDQDFALCPVVGYLAYDQTGVVSIPCLQRTEAKFFKTEGEAIEYIERVHRRGSFAT